MLGQRYDHANFITLEMAQEYHKLLGLGIVVTDGAFIQFEHKKVLTVGAEQNRYENNLRRLYHKKLEE